MKTRYYDLSTEQKLALTSDELSIAIQLESAERGISIPLNLADVIQQQGYVGHSIPADAVGFYEILVPSKYGNPGKSGICFKTEEEAWKAIEGALAIHEDSYPPKQKNILAQGDFSVAKTFLTISRTQQFTCAVKKAEEMREDYETLCEEIAADLSELRQQKYNAEVVAAKKAKYLELAAGDEPTAKRFWANIEKTDWPS